MYINNMNPTPKRPRGAKKKADRIIEGEIELELYEAKTAVMNFLVQPSLKQAFVQACQLNPRSPEVPADVLRDLMLDYVHKYRVQVGTPKS